MKLIWFVYGKNMKKKHRQQNKFWKVCKCCLMEKIYISFEFECVCILLECKYFNKKQMDLIFDWMREREKMNRRMCDSECV